MLIMYYSLSSFIIWITLKHDFSKAIITILIVKYFEYALDMAFKTPIDLILFSDGITLVDIALYLSHTSDSHEK